MVADVLELSKIKIKIKVVVQGTMVATANLECCLCAFTALSCVNIMVSSGGLRRANTTLWLPPQFREKNLSVHSAYLVFSSVI